MNRSRWTLLLPVSALVLAGCGDGSGPDNQIVDCADVTPTVLDVGEHTVIDAAEAGCVQIPAAGASGAEHLYVALSGKGAEVRDGITVDYELSASPPGVAVEADVRPRSTRSPTEARRAVPFHDRIRRLERELVERHRGAAGDPRARAVAAPPTVGDARTFSVCETTACDGFVDVAATAQVVGQRVAIYVEDDAPANGYTQLDLQEVGTLFDDYLYPIDTVAYGRESDLDANDVVVVLLSSQVNRLVPDCNQTGSIVAGYFFGLDLLPNLPNSNGGEIFYGLVPDPGNPSCTIGRAEAIGILPGVFVHEFMHMIGFNQGVLVRGAGSVEQTWLDEGLAHFAEELAGRQVPDVECQPVYETCEAQFITDNLTNSYLYLNDPEESFLIEPDTSSGDLPERGANWLFVRWLADHHAATQPNGTELTRALVQTLLRGSANVEAVTGEPFDQLVSRWQLANYLEDLPGFVPADETLAYTSWAFRDIFALGFDDGVFDKPYPLTPDVTESGTYRREGILRGGSGRHLLVIQPASGDPVTLRLTRDDGSSALDNDAAPRVALVRIR